MIKKTFAKSCFSSANCVLKMLIVCVCHSRNLSNLDLKHFRHLDKYT